MYRTTTPPTADRPARFAALIISALALLAVACSSDPTVTTGSADIAGGQSNRNTEQDGRADQAEGTTGDEGTADSDTADGSEPAVEQAANDGQGLFVADEPTRFFEYDWQVVDVRRSPVLSEEVESREWEIVEPGAPDPDPSDDYVFVDIDVTNPLDSGGFGIPRDWLTLVDASGVGVKPFRAFGRESRRDEARLGAENNRMGGFTVSFRIDAESSLEGGWVEIEQPGYEPAAFGGPSAMTEAARLPATFESTTYDGPFSRDEASVEIVEAYWSRELGLEDDGTLIDSPDNSSRRPPVGHVWLLVHFDVTCRLTGINTGGCNVYGGAVDVDGRLINGSTVNGTGPYAATSSHWAAYAVPTDAESVNLEIGEPAKAINTDFAVADLDPLRSLARPDR